MGTIGTAVTSSWAIESVHHHLALCSQPAGTHTTEWKETGKYGVFLFPEFTKTTLWSFPVSKIHWDNTDMAYYLKTWFLLKKFRIFVEWQWCTTWVRCIFNAGDICWPLALFVWVEDSSEPPAEQPQRINNNLPLCASHSFKVHVDSSSAARDAARLSVNFCNFPYPPCGGMLQERLFWNFLSDVNCCQESMKNNWSDFAFFMRFLQLWSVSEQFFITESTTDLMLIAAKKQPNTKQIKSIKLCFAVGGLWTFPYACIVSWLLYSNKWQWKSSSSASVEELWGIR